VMDFLCAGETWETASNRLIGDSDPQVVVLGPLSKRPDTGHTGRSGIGKAAIGETANSITEDRENKDESLITNPLRRIANEGEDGV
jgi:hypothetical protein